MFGLPKLHLPSLQLPTIHFPTITLPDIDLPDLNLPSIDLPNLHLPRISLPDLSLPSIHLPSLSLPDLDLSFLHLGDILFPDFPDFDLPDLSLPSLHLPTINFPSLRLPRIDLSMLNLPELNLPSITIPSFNIPDLTLPSLHLPNISFPDFDLLHLRLPSISLPSIRFPTFSLPDLNLPDFDFTFPHLPTLRLPSLNLPTISFPSLTLPSIDLPDINLSLLGFPNITLPSIQLPSLSLPDLQLPSLSLPDLHLPDISIPDLHLPGISLAGLGNPVVDFQTSFASGYNVGSRVLDFNGEKRTTLIVNELDLTVVDVLDISGAVAFEFGPTYTVNLSTGIPSNLGIAADLIQPFLNSLATNAGLTIGQNFSTIGGLEVGSITVGAAHLSAFLGYGDPTFNPATHAITNPDELTGFALQDVNLGLAILKSTLPIKKLPKFFGLKATIGSVTTLGMDDVLDLQGQQVSLEVNTGSKWPGKLGPPAVDFLHSFPANGATPAGLAVTMPLGMSPVYLDFDATPRIALEIGSARIRVADFLVVQGALRVEMGQTYTVNVNTGIPANLGVVLGTIGLDSLVNQLTGYAGITIGPNFSSINGLGVGSMTIGASHLNAFIGVGNPDFSSNLSTQDLTGFALQDVTLGMAILKPTLPISKLPKFTALKATAGSFTTVGMSDFLDVHGTGISLEVNTGSKWPGKLGPPTLDFLHSLPGAANVPPGLAVAMPLNAAPVYLDFDAGQRIALSINSATVKVADFVHLQGGIRIEMGATYIVDVDTGIPSNIGQALAQFGLDDVAADLLGQVGITLGSNFSSIHGLEVRSMTIGGTDFSAFIGVGTPDFTGNLANQDLTGFALQHVDFGIGILKPTLPFQKLPKFTALKATAGSFSTLGMGDVLNLQGTGLSLEVNTGSKWPGELGTPTIDFQQSFRSNWGAPVGLAVPRAAGASPFYLDFAGGQRIAFGIDSATVALADFVHLQGGIRFEMGARYTLDVNTGIPANWGTLLGSTGLGDLLNSITGNLGVTIEPNLSVIHGLEFRSMTIGGTDISAFIGVGSPSFNGDLNTQDLVGFGLQHVNFGLGILKSTLPIPQIPKFTALKATAGSFGLLGMGDVIDLQGTGVSVEVNTGSKWPGGFGPPTVNFQQSFPAQAGNPAGLAVPRAGGASPIYLDFDAQPRIAVGISSATVNVADFIVLHGGIRFEVGPKYVVDIATGIPANLGAALGSIGLDGLVSQLTQKVGVTIGQNFASIHGLEVGAMTIGGSNIDAFVGIGDFDFGRPLADQDVFGFKLEGLDFGLGLFKSTLPIQALPKFTALKAHADTFQFRAGSSSIMAVDGSDITLNVNTGTAWPGGIGTPVINFKSSFETTNGANNGQLEVKTTGVPVNLDFDGNNRIGVEVADAKVSLFSTLYARGGFAFEKGPRHIVTVATGIPSILGGALDQIGLNGIANGLQAAGLSIGNNFSTISGLEVQTMTIGASGMNAFVGVGDYDFDQPVDDQDLFGLAIENLDLGIAMLDPTLPISGLPRFVAAKATADLVALKTGSSDFITLEGRGIEFNMNSGSEWPGGLGPPVVDFQASFPNGAGPAGLEVKTGGDPVLLDFDGNYRISVGVEKATIAVSDFFYLSGSVYFEMGPGINAPLAPG